MKECRVIGCKNMIHSRGWCGKHYQRYLRWGKPEGKDPRLYEGILQIPIEEVAPEKRHAALAGQNRFWLALAKLKAKLE